MVEYDYIVVGAGSAGCILANRLAAGNASVLLLEAGGSDENRYCQIPGMVSVIHAIPQVKQKFDWGYYTTPQVHAAQRRIPSTRGKVLGGSSSINGMLFVRGHRQNFDDWAAEGCKGWAFDDVLPSFKRLEDWEGGATALRGAGGPIAVTKQKDITEASQALVEAMAAACGVPVVDDYNAESQEGSMVFQSSTRKGLRYSTSLAYLRRNQQKGLTVRPTSTVTRIVIERSKAVGVEIAVGREREVIRAKSEVILAAGVFGSPHLLLLSGVGPAAHLTEHGIPVVSDLPVGDNLHDHLFVPLTFLAKGAVHRGTAMHFLGGVLSEAFGGDTWFGRTVFEGGAFVRSKHASRGIPDLQIHSLPWAYPSPNQDAPIRHVVDKRPALTIMPTLIYPESRGRLRLASANPLDAPQIDPAYLSEPRDAQFLLDGVRLARDIMAHPLMKGVVTAELHPGPSVADEAALRRELPTRIHSVYHPVGTCRMGTDERAVVDPKLRVYGVEGLRVVDASIMPSVTGGNTNAPAMMIGERAAELMRAEVR